jgi:hypothetical protein
MSPEDARFAFFVLQFMRLSGLLFALFGVAVIAGKIALPTPIGSGFVLFGVIEGLLLPAMLRRKWKSRGE